MVLFYQRERRHFALFWNREVTIPGGFLFMRVVLWREKFLAGYILSLLALGMGGCGSLNPPSPVGGDIGAPRDVADTPDSGDAARSPSRARRTEAHSAAMMAANACNALGVEIFARMEDDPGLARRNYAVSPYGFGTAAGILFGGAAGKTAGLLAGVMHLGGGPDEAHLSFSALGNELFPAATREKHPGLRAATALWACRNAGLLGSFLELTERYYGARVENLDFQNAAEGARARMRSWVAEKSGGRINPAPGLSPVPNDSDLRLALTSVACYEGEWLFAFDPANTRSEVFQNPAAGNPLTPMMRQTRTFRHAETAEWSALEMPLKDGAFSLCALLPRSAGPMPRLTSETLGGCLALLQPRRVSVSFPRLPEFAAVLSTAPYWKSAGMRDLFTEGAADFSDMNGAHDLYVGEMEQAARVKIGRESEADSSSAAALMRLTASPFERPVVFRADRPFVFLIRHNSTGCILFIGKCVEPERRQAN